MARTDNLPRMQNQPPARRVEAEGLASIDRHSLIALGVVVVAAAVSGVAFSWRYYSKRS